MKPVTILGAGGWGTALAVHIARQQRPVTLWTRRQELAEQLMRTAENEPYLPGVTLPPGLTVTHDLEKAVYFSNYYILAVPSQSTFSIASTIQPFIQTDALMLNTAKGLEVHSGRRLSTVLHDALPHLEPTTIATLSGPNHAEEVGRGVPSATVVAAPSPSVTATWQELLGTQSFRVYRSSDQIGVELAGATKNVIALAAGISDGLGYGDNTKAALVTRGLAEMTRLGIKLGGQALTFSGLAGLGDLMVTCSSKHSRNRAAGEAIGSGTNPSEAVRLTGKIVEGVATCSAVRELAHELNIDMPITEAVYRIIYEAEDPRTSVITLLSRDPKQELESPLS